MNSLEAWFETLLGLLIEPRWPVLADTILDSLKAEGSQFALWAIKTASMFDLASAAKEKVFAASVFPDIRDGKIPYEFIIEVAHSKEKAFACSLSRGFQVINGGEFHYNQEHESLRGFHFTVQFNHLLIRAASIPDAEPAYLEEPKRRSPVRVYPEFFRHQVGGYSYAHFGEFREKFAIYTSADLKQARFGAKGVCVLPDRDRKI